MSARERETGWGMAECCVRGEGVRDAHAVVLGGDQTARAACCSYFGTALGNTTGTAATRVVVLFPCSCSSRDAGVVVAEAVRSSNSFCWPAGSFGGRGAARKTRSRRRTSHAPRQPPSGRPRRILQDRPSVSRARRRKYLPVTTMTAVHVSVY